MIDEHLEKKDVAFSVFVGKKEAAELKGVTGLLNVVFTTRHADVDYEFMIHFFLASHV